MQNKFQSFQNKLQSTVQGLNANITDGATRLRQQIAQNASSGSLFNPQQATGAAPLQATPAHQQLGEASPSPQDGYMRLPIESAKKLRWYDQSDVKMIIQLHLREKHELQQANALLREALGRLGGSRQAEVQAVNAAIDKLKEENDAVNDVLVLAAQAEIERLEEKVEGLTAELKAVKANAPSGAAAEPIAENKQNEEEQQIDQEQHESPRTHTPQDSSICSQCHALRQQTARLSSALAEATSGKEIAEQQLASTRDKFHEMQQAQIEVVKLAQDERLQAEARCEEAENRAAKQTQRAEQLALELKTAKVRAEKAEVELKKEKSRGTARAEAHVAHHRAKAGELESANSLLSQQLASAQSQVTALEHRLAVLEAEAARSAADAKDLESAAAERDVLQARLAAAEARLEDSRATQLSTESLREMLKQSEAKRLAAEEELVATAKLAAQLEERIAKATMDAENAVIVAQQAQVRAAAAWEAIEKAVEKRWSEAGADRTRWPARAQEEAEAIEARLSALNAAHKSLQEKLAEAQAAQQDAEKRASASEHKCSTSDAAMERLTRSAEQRERRLEAAALAATRQVDEFRSELGRLQRERDHLLDEKKSWEEASKAATAAIAGARLRAGGGSISEGSEADTNKDAYLVPTPRPGKEASIDSTDFMYLRNVLLKFLGAHLEGRHQECDVLLPALAAVVRASPAEYKKLKDVHAKAHAAFGGWI